MEYTNIQTASPSAWPPELLSQAENLCFATTDDDIAHAFYYAPHNPRYRLNDGEKPPLIVNVHGGPTTSSTASLNPRFQFWTSRGFAVLDVNYRGSTGYGRNYRRKLDGAWGIKDVADCVHGAQHLVTEGRVDPHRLFIMGGSAGGYTVLSALAYTDVFNGGISSYGIGDLAVLANDTHKFEARYADRLIGPFDAALYRQRSPLFAAQDIDAPVLFFQGTEDKVVPPNQTEDMVAALKSRQVPVAYVSMQGEGHGFRRSDSIETMLAASLTFLCRLSGCTPAEGAADLHIDNDHKLQTR